MTTPGADHLRHLAEVVHHNLANQQDWTDLHVYDGQVNGGEIATASGRILLAGLPPYRLYVHPDEQVEIMRAERALGPAGGRIPQPPEHEWVLPMHLSETPTISSFAAVFDAIGAVPPAAEQSVHDADAAASEWKQWRGARRGKRILLAVVQDDSTVVYYFMHDGIVKPRQN